MAGGKITVRQKMINMMYLVLTAMLALNVSKEILRAFYMVEASLDKSGVQIDAKNKAIMAAFENSMNNEPEKTRPFYEKAKQAEKITAEFLKYLDDLKMELETSTGGRSKGEEDAGELIGKDNMEKHATLLLSGDGHKGKGKILKDKINTTRQSLLNLLDKDDQAKLKSDFIALDGKQSWENEMFEHMPLAAVITFFAKIKNDAKSTEADILDILGKAIDKKSVFTADRLDAQIVGSSKAVMVGQEFTADVLLVASNSQQQADIYVNGQLLKQEDGIGKYTMVPSAAQENTVKATIKIKTKEGEKTLEKEFKFDSYAPLINVAADKMNVLYIGLENPMTISVPGIASDRVFASMSAGSLVSKGGGKYIANVSAPGNLTINVSVKMPDGSTKAMGSIPYRTKTVPQPYVQAGAIDRSGGQPSAVVKTITGVYATLGQSFVYDGLQYTVNKFSMIHFPKGKDPVVMMANGGALSPQMTTATRNAKSGDKYIFYDVYASCPMVEGGKVKQLNSSVFINVQ